MTTQASGGLSHSAWMGVTVDHLYPDCPSCPQPATQCVGMVDPYGTDICGLCVRRWRRTMGERINAAASEAVFKLDVSVMRDDYQTGGVSAGTLTNQIHKLASRYGMPSWLVRGLVERPWASPGSVDVKESPEGASLFASDATTPPGE